MIRKLAPRPLATGAVLLLGLGAASAWDWGRRVDAWHRMIHGYAIGLSGSVAHAVASKVNGGVLDAAAASKILEKVVARRNPGLLFMALVVDGKVVAKAGDPDSGIEVEPPAHERDADGRLIIWRPAAADALPPLPEYGLFEPRHPPPPHPGELVERPFEGPVATSGLRGTFVLGFDVSLRGERARRELVDAGSRLGLLALASAGLFVAYAAGKRSERQTFALESERTRSRNLEQIGFTAAGLAHETKNPLGIIMGLAQQISRDATVPKEHRLRARQIIDAADRASSRLGEFIHYARLRDPTVAAVALPALVRATLELLEPDAAAAGVSLVAEVEVAAVRADEGMLQQILLNVVANAIQASALGTRVVVRARRAGSGARLDVEDEGHGIAPELLPHVFDAYVTGRADGHGLGLAIVKRLVELHGWTVALASEPGKGTRLSIDGIEVARGAEEGA